MPPIDTRLHNIAERLTAMQEGLNHVITATISHNGHYYHEYCTDIDVEFTNDDTDIEYYDQDAEKETIMILRNYMKWIYRQLEKEYEYATTKEAIIETIEANDYDFTAEGVID